MSSTTKPASSERDERALEYQRIAEHDAMSHPSLAGVAPRAVQRVAVIGAGTMGVGIAIAALDAGCNVTLVEQHDAALTRGWGKIKSHYVRRVQSGKVTADEAAAREERLVATTDWNEMRDVDLVIEAVFEEMAIKCAVFARLDGIVRPGAILATNTSYLDIDAMASATSGLLAVITKSTASKISAMR